MKKLLSKIFGIRKIFYIPILIVLSFGYILAAISPNVEVRYVYKVLPAFVVYIEDINTNVNIDEPAGITIAMIVAIDKNYRNNEIVFNHEMIHVKQGYRSLFLNNLYSLYSVNHYVKEECEAYASEITSEWYASFLADVLKDAYKPSLTKQEIEDYLLYYWKKQSK